MVKRGPAPFPTRIGRRVVGSGSIGELAGFVNETGSTDRAGASSPLQGLKTPDRPSFGRTHPSTELRINERDPGSRGPAHWDPTATVGTSPPTRASLAQEADLDLVEIAPMGQAPVKSSWTTGSSA